MDDYITKVISSLNSLYIDVNILYINSTMDEASLKASLSTLYTHIDNTIIVYSGPNKGKNIFKELFDTLSITFNKINTIFSNHELLIGTTFYNKININYLNKLKVNSYPINQYTEVIENLLALLLKPASKSQSIPSMQDNNIHISLSKICI